MATREQRTHARRLWLEGTHADDEIAAAVGVTAEEIDRWREDENWGDLRDVIDARAAVKQRNRAADADNRTEILIDVLDNLASKLLQRGSGTLTPNDLRVLANVIETDQKIRHNLELSRKARRLEKE